MDRDGTTLADAMRGAGFADELGPSHLLRDPAAFVELHVEQGRALAAPIGIATAIWPHGRWRLDITGEGNHAGTTRLADRRDPMLTYAETVLAVRKKAGLAGALATFGRVEVEPGGSNAIPSEVRAWLDARAPDEAILERLLAEIAAHATARASRDGTELSISPESISPAVHFTGPLYDRVRTVLPTAPVLPTGAGHDAGVLATAGIPTAMLFVRNPTGISHAPAEFAEPADCLVGVIALADVLQELTCR
jgi:N-carbamoyl-L-amino-acid hydrolase